MNKEFSEEVRSIRATHTRLENRIATLERMAPGEHGLPALPVESSAARIRPNQPERDHTFQPDRAEAAPPKPSPRTSPVPNPPAPPRPRTNDFELHVGRVWLVRIGIVVLLTGLVFLGNFAYHEIVPRLGPAGKLSLLALAASALAAIGHFVRRRPDLANYGRVLTGGALATAYYTTFAAHFVEPLRVISSPFLGGTLLLACAASILWLADRLRSQTIAAVTISLAFYTAAINPISHFSLFSNLLLAIVGVTLLLRHRWTTVTFLSLAGTYAAFAFWRLVNTGTIQPFHAPTESVFWTAIAFPACYWIVFTTAVVLGRDRVFPKQQLATFLTLNNAAFYGLIAPVIAGTHPDALGWSTVAYGFVLLGISRLNSAASGSYLTQGLGLISAGILLEFTGYQRALIFAFQSVLLLKLSRSSHGRIYQAFSGLAALVATTVALQSLVVGNPHAPLVAAAVATLQIANALLFKFQRHFLFPLSRQWRVAAFAGLATILAFATVFQTTTGDARLVWLLALGLAATFAIRYTRLPELALTGQTLLLAAQVCWFLRGGQDFLTLALVAGGGIALIHWWQLQRAVPIPAATRLACQALHTILPLAAIGNWAAQLTPVGNQPILFASLSLGILIYGLATRAVTIATGSSVFTLVATVLTAVEIATVRSWNVALIATALIGLQSVALSLLAPNALLPRQIVRATALLLASGMIFAFVPEGWRFPIFSLAGLALFAIASRSANAEPLMHSAVLATFGFGAFTLGFVQGHPATALDAIGFLAFLAAQQLDQRSAFARLTPGAMSGFILVGLGGIWFTFGRSIADFADGILITASWSLLATAVLAVGFAIRERTYRHAGLGILLCALARLVLIDVWQFDTLTRILSFITLGAVLLLTGFFYNRFANTLRRWL